VEHDKAVEINISANLLNPHYPERFVRQYLEYLSELESKGVRLSIGSDCHSAHYEIDFDTVGQMLESVGIENDLWCLPPRIEANG
jgi:histidinol phosphatase-like PHP family hydrolase